jgi:hypothetical protein
MLDANFNNLLRVAPEEKAHLLKKSDKASNYSSAVAAAAAVSARHFQKHFKNGTWQRRRCAAWYLKALIRSSWKTGQCRRLGSRQISLSKSNILPCVEGKSLSHCHHLWSPLRFESLASFHSSLLDQRAPCLPWPSAFRHRLHHGSRVHGNSG